MRKDNVAIYRSIWTLFPPSVKGLDVLYKAKHFVVPSVGGATGFTNLPWKFSKV